jgi:sec-independent protein translocase protein TatC
MSNNAEMTILEHLDELRSRLLKIVIAVVVGMIAGTFIAQPVLKLLLAPVQDTMDVVALSPTEAPAVFFRVAIVVGIVIAMPVIMYQLFQFAAPGLEQKEKRYVLIGAPAASAAFAAGVVFATLVILPSALPFLQGFLAEIVKQQYSIEKYISFVSTILLWIGLVFETPLVMYFLAKLGVVSPSGYAKARRIVIVAAAAVSAIITPTVDPVNMLLVMGPFLVLYEIGILLAKIG